jgi:hypothetical protein
LKSETPCFARSPVTTTEPQMSSGGLICKPTEQPHQHGIIAGHAFAKTNGRHLVQR